MRTIGLFSKLTPIEEAEAIVRDEAPDERDAGPRDIVAEAEDCAIRWLGLDAFQEGDDIKIAVHRAGHAVMVLVNTNPPKGAPCSTRTIKLSKTQWAKLKSLAREA